jgi:hypothetical protein
LALNLKHQTASEFATRFWRKVQYAQEHDKILFGKLCAWLLVRIAAGDITDTQARLSFNAVFSRSLTAGQWSTLKTTRLQPAADRYNAMQAEGSL